MPDQTTSDGLGDGAPPPGDRGFRSVQVNFVSRVEDDRLMVFNALLDNSDCRWIGGEGVGAGIPIQPGVPWTWGVLVYRPGFTAGASMSFAQMDQPRGGLTFSNDADGNSACIFSPEDGITATVTQDDTGDPNHSVFKVEMTGSPR